MAKRFGKIRERVINIWLCVAFWKTIHFCLGGGSPGGAFETVFGFKKKRKDARKRKSPAPHPTPLSPFSPLMSLHDLGTPIREGKSYVALKSLKRVYTFKPLGVQMSDPSCPH